MAGAKRTGLVKAPETGSGTGGLRTLERGIAVLELLGAAQDPMSLSAIAAKINLPVGTTYRILRTLVAHGYVERDVQTKWYELGLKVLELRGAMTVGAIRMAADMRPMLKSLAKRTRERTHLAVYRGGNVIYVDRVDPFDEVPYFPLGLQVPAHVTGLGKAILAFKPEAEVKAYADGRLGLAYTPNTITTEDRLRAELAETNARGYATDWGEHHLHVYCIGAPVFDHTGKAIAAVSVTGAADTIRPRETELAREVISTAAEVSERLGYRPADVAAGYGIR